MAYSTLKRFPRILPNGTIEILLTKGYVTVVDAKHSDLAAFNWCAQEIKNPNGKLWVQAKRNSTVGGKRHAVFLHREILSRILGRELTIYDLPDHIDLNPLNNQECNLRLATQSQNRTNQGIAITNTSGFKGVSWHKRSQKWVAYIYHDYKYIHLGYFVDINAAHLAYCEASKLYHGTFGRTD